MTTFDDAAHFAVGSKSSTLNTQTGLFFRWSEISLAALRSAGILNTMVDGTDAPDDTSILWLDKNTDPAALKRYDATEAEWVAVTYEWFRHNTGADYVSRAAAEASVPVSLAQKITIFQDGTLLSFVRGVTDDPALTTADGAKWVPDLSQITPMHWGAVGDGSTDDTVAINAMLDWVGANNAAAWTEDFKNTFPAPTEITGVSGKTFCVSEPISLGGSHKSLRFSNLAIKAIGDWSAVADEDNFIFDLGGLATYVRFERVWLNCNNISGGIKARARARIVGCWFEKVAKIGVEGAGSDVWLVESILSQWTTNDAEYYVPAKYTGVLVKITESDMRVTGCTFRWADVLMQIESTNNIIQHCHMFNGMKGYLAADRDAATNTALEAYFGFDVSGDDLTRRTAHEGVVVGRDAGAGGKSWASTFDQVYFDNCHHELYVDGMIFNKCKFGSKDSSSLLSEDKSTAGLTPYGDAPTITYWFRMHAYEAACSTQLRLAEPESYVTSALRYWVKYVPKDGYSWAADTSVLSNSTEYNQARADNNKQLGDGFLLGQKNVHVGDPFQGPLITWFGLRDSVRIALMNNTATSPTELRLLGDEFQIRPKGVTAFKVDEDKTTVDALVVEADEIQFDNGKATAIKPYFALGIGQSNMDGNQYASGGNMDANQHCFAWDQDSSDNPMVAGTQFLPAEIGTAPYNSTEIGTGDPVNYFSLHTMKHIQEVRGGETYLVQIAQGSTPIESWMHDDDLTANGWMLGGSYQDLYPFMINALTAAKAQVPGTPDFLDLIMFCHGNANSDDSADLYAYKVQVVLDRLVTEGFASYESTKVLVGELVHGSAADIYKGTRQQKALRRLANNPDKTNKFDVGIIPTRGLNGINSTPAHFTGEALVQLGYRYGRAALITEEAPDDYADPDRFNPNYGLNWAVKDAFVQNRELFRRPPENLGNEVVTTENSHAVLGTCYKAAAGDAIVLSDRLVQAVPQGGVRISMEAAVDGGANSSDYSVCVHQWDGDGNHVGILNVPTDEFVTVVGDTGRQVISKTFSNPLSTVVGNAVFDDDARYYSVCFRAGILGTGDESFFNVLGYENIPDTHSQLVNVLNWGCSVGFTLAAADTQPDDASRIQAAADYCIANNIGELHFPAGYVRADSAIIVDGRLKFVGLGMFSSFLHATHTIGAAVRFKNSASGTRNIGITAGAARRASDVGGNRSGIRFEDDDQSEATANRMLYCEVVNTYTYGHPDNHIHIVGPAFTGVISNSSFSTGKRHGVHFERGVVSGRSNLVTGLISLGSVRDCRFNNLAGHTIAGGLSTDAYSTPALRVIVDNCEGGNNGTDRSVMYADAAVYLRGANHKVMNCGFEHPNAIAFFAGRNHHFNNNRILGNGIEQEFDPSTAVEISTEVFTIAGHGFQDGYNVKYSNGSGTDIGGLTDGAEYYVIDATTDTFKVSATEGGSAVNLTSVGTGSDHTLISRGCAVIVGTYDELPTDGVYIEGVSIINPARKLSAIVVATLPSGETVEPRNIYVNYDEIGNFTRVARTDSTMGNGGPERIIGLAINGDRPTLSMSADVTVNNTTSYSAIGDLRQRVGAGERLRFEATIEYQGASPADIRIKFSAPAGSTCRYSSVGAMRVNSADVISIDPVTTASTAILYGAGGISTPRIASIVGFVDNIPADGYLEPQFTQIAATASDTSILAGLSSIKFSEIQ